MAQLCPFFRLFYSVLMPLLQLQNPANTRSREPLKLGLLYLAYSLGSVCR